MINLKPCPFCGMDDIIIRTERMDIIDKDPFTIFRVWCLNCDRGTGFFASPLGAIRRWNKWDRREKSE